MISESWILCITVIYPFPFSSAGNSHRNDSSLFNCSLVFFRIFPSQHPGSISQSEQTPLLHYWEHSPSFCTSLPQELWAGLLAAVTWFRWSLIYKQKEITSRVQVKLCWGTTFSPAEAMTPNFAVLSSLGQVFICVGWTQLKFILQTQHLEALRWK